MRRQGKEWGEGVRVPFPADWGPSKERRNLLQRGPGQSPQKTNLIHSIGRKYDITVIFGDFYVRFYNQSVKYNAIFIFYNV